MYLSNRTLINVPSNILSGVYLSSAPPQVPADYHHLGDIWPARADFIRNFVQPKLKVVDAGDTPNGASSCPQLSFPTTNMWASTAFGQIIGLRIRINHLATSGRKFCL